MQRIDQTAANALRMMLDTQPMSSAKATFAWQIAAGPALARSARVEWQEGAIVAYARSEAWRREISRARPIILGRLAHLLGVGVVRDLEIVVVPGEAQPGPRSSGS